MAPIGVIDLTSSPEPEDTPARAAALLRFKPRKERSRAGHEAGNSHVTTSPLFPSNGLPFFYGNDEQQPEEFNVGGASGANAISIESYTAPATAPGKALNIVTKGRSHDHKSVAAPGLNGIANGAPAAVGGSHGHPAPFATSDRQQSANTTPCSAMENGSAPDAAISSYRNVLDFAQPLKGMSPECRRRLYEPRNALIGTPLDVAMQQDILRTGLSPSRTGSMSVSKLHTQRQQPAEPERYPCPLADAFDCAATFGTSGHAVRHARAHTGQKNEVCPSCNKRFSRRDKMEDHRKRCEARRDRCPASQSAAHKQQLPPAVIDLEPDNLRGTLSENVFANQPYNVLKRSSSLSPSTHHDAHNDTAKRPRLDVFSPESQEQPCSRLQIIDTTDTVMNSFVLNNKSVSLDPSQTSRSLAGADAAPLANSLPAGDLSSGPSRAGLPYSAEEDALLIQLKDAYRLPWPSVAKHFSGRTQGSLTVRYYDLRKKESGIETAKPRAAPQELRSNPPAKRIRKTPVASGMVPWASVKNARLEESRAVEARREKRPRKRWREHRVSELAPETESAQSSSSEDEEPREFPPKDSSYPSSMSRILRLRELGVHGRRAWSASSRSVSDELKDHIFSDYGLQRDYQGASGDVISLAWNHHGRFAAGSVAITDQQSMQYNMHRNLLVGDTNRGEIEELVDHHIPRPIIESTTNINSNHAMRESQDPRLFVSVVAAKFCPMDSTRLFTASMDKTLRHFTVERDEVTHRYAINHTAPVSVLCVGNHGLVASGCHQSTRSINVFKCDKQKHEVKLQLSARQITMPVYPSSLKWGVAHQHQQFLLAGFSGEGDIASTATGETCLWDATTGQQIHVGGATRNVFDVAWNPIPSSSSIAFAVAGNANGHVVDKGMRSVIQCFAAGQRGGRGVLDWQSPASDINDLVFCPYDDNLIAAGATNGRVYVWDKRSADRSQRPLHTLKHGESLNVLDHDRDKEMADTGVQFLSWGPTKNRLYSGSSDGIVKIWNPYRSPDSAHVGDIPGPSRDRVAIMSGAFSPDFQDLLVGTENGRINLFKSVSSAVHGRPPQFKLKSAPEPEKEQQEPFIAARALLKTGQVELRPCGGMPFRQAVQGPNYQGPYLEPSTTQREEAQQRLFAARHAQKMGEGDSVKAAAAVQAAEEGLTDLQRREYGAIMAKPQAEGFQRELAKLERARHDLEALVGKVERCKLNCAVLSNGEDDEEVEVSGRSESRIPGLLRFAANDAVVMEGDATPSPCPRCVPGRMRLPNESLWEGGFREGWGSIGIV